MVKKTSASVEAVVPVQKLTLEAIRESLLYEVEQDRKELASLLKHLENDAVSMQKRLDRGNRH